MQALRITDFGPPENLHLSDVEHPRLSADEALVEIHAAGLNPSDIGNAAGRFTQTDLPRILGRDFAGIVIEGPEHMLGHEVWGGGAEFGFTRDGSHAEYIAAPSAVLCPKPVNLSMEQASAVATPFVTAWLSLEASQLQAGQSLLVMGARGAVGNAALQLGKARGLRLFGAQRGELPTEDMYKAINTEHPDAQQELLKLTQGRGVDACIDTVGGPLFNLGLSCLTHSGCLIAITARAEGIVQFNMRNFYHRELRLFGVNSLNCGATQTRDVLNKLRQDFEAGELHAPNIRTFPLHEAPQIYQQLAQGVLGTKAVFVP
ncbi:quinone oxidoreductase family protein [Ktedonospora formicarum]|uniref:Oxidoreductase n=1 Tax=Ktedonospora formicarum TaxID=2778364 RepID=A0A8J3MS23_9CHLR|nr:zinc-binding alcohol dehydrogenase family protein [Ktedonospora formicarum]GHO46662.1 oxidoreductase [Ktedonospora formicarum]